VTDIIMARLPKTLLLVGTAMIFSIIVGITTGIISAIKQYSIIDYLATFFSFFWLSIPGFFLSLLVIYIFAVKLDWFPVFGASSPGAENPTLDRIHHLILPAAVLGLELAAALTRYTRASLVEVLRADYMRTAQAKGLKYWSVIIGHGLKNALIPIITVIAFRLPYLISGAVVIETVFQWPGLGLLTLDAANHKDYPLILAITMTVTVVVVISSLLADIAYGIADPRIRLQ
jgi:peptide/nickel transport system permease protein